MGSSSPLTCCHDNFLLKERTVLFTAHSSKKTCNNFTCVIHLNYVTSMETRDVNCVLVSPLFLQTETVTAKFSGCHSSADDDSGLVAFDTE
jgi:hypothetical protein